MYGYKVVYKSMSSKLISAIDVHGEVSYTLKMKTVPRKGCGPLAAFDTYDHAWNFTHELGLSPMYFKIYRCRIKKSKVKGLWDSYCEQVYEPNYAGTVYCDSITLIKEG